MPIHDVVVHSSKGRVLAPDCIIETEKKAGLSGRSMQSEAEFDRMMALTDEEFRARLKAAARNDKELFRRR